MKALSKLTLSLAVVSTVLFTGCNNAPAKQEVVKPEISEVSLGLRKVDLYSESDAAPAATAYRKASAGSSSKINRAFQDAPPMIPHDVDGMLPIKIGNNQCIGCHMPEVASAVGATPVPVSHLTNFRPTKSYALANMNTSSEKLAHISIKDNGGKLVGARYNCSQCHAPQSQGNLAVENTFEPDYTSKDGAHRSSWKGSKWLESINTTK